MSTPHVCPKCNGEGTSDGQPALGRLTTKCWPCGGAGLVWEPGIQYQLSSPFQNPPLMNPSTWPYRPYPVELQPGPSQQGSAVIYSNPCPYCQGPCKSHAY